jgi:hypothetical protein
MELVCIGRDLRRGRLLAWLVLGLSAPAHAGVLHVPGSFPRISDALAAASPFDTVLVGPGTFASSQNGESFPLAMTTDDVSLLGAGSGVSILDAETQGSVISFACARGRVSGFTLTGGRAGNGGGIAIASGTPEIDHNWLLSNGATFLGSGIHAAAGSAPWIHHNVVWQSYDTDVSAPGDPHGIQLADAGGLVEHNLIGRGDSNGLINTGETNPIIRNNIFYENGIPGLRGRGICALGGSATVISNNLFFGNAVAALLVRTPSGTLDVTATQGNDYSDSDGIFANLDGDPTFVNADGHDWHLQAGSPAIDAGDSTTTWDPDGTRPDIGPLYFDQRAVDVEPPLAGGIPLLTSAPNPFSSSTTLVYVLPQTRTIRLSIYGLDGRRVASLFEGLQSAGPHQVHWEGRDRLGRRVAPGVYLAQLRVGAESKALKLMVVR